MGAKQNILLKLCRFIKIGCKKKGKSTFLAQKMYETAKFLNIYMIFSNIDNKNNKISQKRAI